MVDAKGLLAFAFKLDASEFALAVGAAVARLLVLVGLLRFLRIHWSRRNRISVLFGRQFLGCA
jgi:hypothetical protein